MFAKHPVTTAQPPSAANGHLPTRIPMLDPMHVTEHWKIKSCSSFQHVFILYSESLEIAGERCGSCHPCPKHHIHKRQLQGFLWNACFDHTVLLSVSILVTKTFRLACHILYISLQVSSIRDSPCRHVSFPRLRASTSTCTGAKSQHPMDLGCLVGGTSS